MVSVRVILAVEISGVKERELFLHTKKATLSNLIELIGEKYDKNFPKKILYHETSEFSVGILVNGIGVRTLDTPISDGDTVIFFVPRDGG